MINGLNDNIFPTRLSQRVMFEDLPCPLNQHTLLDVQHGIPGEQVAPIFEPWLEKVWASMEEGNDDAATE